MLRPEDFRESGDQDDTESFERCLLAMNPDNSVNFSRSDTIQLSARRYHLRRRLRTHANPLIRGVNRPSVAAGARSVLDFSDGPPGLGVHLPGFRGYDRAIGTGRLTDLAIVTAPVAAGAVAFDVDLSVGSLVRIPNDHQFTYEVVQAGHTPAPPAAFWSASTTYAVGARIIPPTFDGHFYRCEQAGTSGATEPAWNFDTKARVNDGGVVWIEDGSCFDGIADVAMLPFVGASESDVLWLSNRHYEYNSVVRVEGVWDVVFWLGPQGFNNPIGGTSGTTAPTSGAPETTVSDGNLTWTRKAAAPYLWTFGTAILQPRRHPGIAGDTLVDIDGVEIINACGNAIHVNGTTTPAKNVNFSRIREVTQYGCHGFIRVRGSDGSGGRVSGCTAFGQPGLGEADYAYRDNSLSGWHWHQNCVENPGGAAFYVHTAGGRPLVMGGYVEAAHKSHFASATVVEGVSGLVYTDTSVIKSLGEGQGIVGVDKRVSGDEVYGGLAGANLPAGMAVGYGSAHEGEWFGITHTSRMSPMLPEHCWVEGYGSSPVFQARMVTSAGAAPHKDESNGTTREVISPAREAIHYYGPEKWILISGVWVNLGPNCIAWRPEVDTRHTNGVPNSGAWRKGDEIRYTEAITERAVGCICLTDGKFGTVQEPTFQQIILPAP